MEADPGIPEAPESNTLLPDELEEVPSTEDPKQQLSDTYITFIPKNSTGFTTKGHVVEIVIPRTEHVIDLARSYIDLNLKLGLKHNGAAFNKTNLENDDRLFVGMINAATIFDQTRILNNGKCILSDTFCQVNSRIWQMTKPSHYLKQQYASFINLDDITNNEGYIMHEITATEFNNTAVKDITYKLKIPLPCLFPCFDNANSFGTSQLNDDVTLSMQLSFPDRFLCWVIADKNGKVKKIEPFSANKTAVYNVKKETTGAKTSYTVEYDEGDGANPKYYIDDYMRIIAPAHYPTPTESGALTGLVDNEGASFPFITCDIQEQKASFAPGNVTDSRTIPVGTVTEWDSTVHLNYTTHTNNIFAVLMMSSHEHSYVAFDKPYIENIECNLSELIKLANGKVHTGSNYDDAVDSAKPNDSDNDMFKDLANALGADGFRNFERYDEAIRRDYMQKLSTNENMLASYMQYYPVACGQMLGVSSDYFAHQINYKCKPKWSYNTAHGEGEGAVDYTVCTAGAHNYNNASVFCCQLTFKRLLFVNGGLDIENPLSDTYDIRRHLRGEVSGNAHGILDAFSGPITNLMKSAGNTIRNEIYRIKRNKNTTHAYTRLGKDGYEKHKDIIDANATMGHRGFKKFINNLIESERQLSGSGHGLRDPNALGGSASVTLGQATQQIAGEKGVDIRMLNLNVYHQSRNADFADRIGWKHQLILDYKYSANAYKIRLSSWGVESAILGVNNAHGLGTWLKEKWRKTKTFFKERALPWLKEQGSKLLKNAKDVAMGYVNKVLNGEIRIKDVPKRFLPYVNQIIQNGDLTKNMDPRINEAIETARKLRTGELKMSDIPDEILRTIRSMNLDGNGSENTGNGLVIRHGFIGYVRHKPNVPYPVMKRRMEMLLDRPPSELSDKDFRNIYAYKRLRERPLVDKHGTLGVTLRRLYGEPIYRRKLISENRVHGLPLIAPKKPMKPFKKELIDRYFGGDLAKYKDWRHSRKLKPHEDITPVNSPLMQQVDVNHGIKNDDYSDADFEREWKKHKAEIKAKMKSKLKKRAKGKQ